MLLLARFKFLSIISVAIVAVSIISSCGLKPLHSKGGSVSVISDLSAIQVEKINFGRAGQVLQTKLEDLINPKSLDTKKRYKLLIDISSHRSPLAVEQDAEITSYNLIVTAKFRLMDYETGSIIFKNKSVITGSYQTVTSDFATYTVEEDTLIRVVKEAADDIKMRLSSYFVKNIVTQSN